mmetsp:Transcript_53431/g.126372  ORF Transcript_53431/g.126372 Transcript_53431/m.126372 type:complete len:203 (+) Transcript_53431:234-842(+)
MRNRVSVVPDSVPVVKRVVRQPVGLGVLFPRDPRYLHSPWAQRPLAGRGLGVEEGERRALHLPRALELPYYQHRVRLHCHVRCSELLGDSQRFARRLPLCHVIRRLPDHPRDIPHTVSLLIHDADAVACQARVPARCSVDVYVQVWNNSLLLLCAALQPCIWRFWLCLCEWRSFWCLAICFPFSFFWCFCFLWPPSSSLGRT